MLSFAIDRIKTALERALEALPDWNYLNQLERGTVIDKSFKSFLQDLMNQFGMEAGKDYEGNLAGNAKIADFVVLSERADDLIRGLLEGKIKAINVSGHFRTSKLGNSFEVQPHVRFQKVA